MADDDRMFDEGQASDMSTILLMRIYDVLLCEFLLSHPEEGIKMHDLHAKGGLLGPMIALDPEEMIQK